MEVSVHLHTVAALFPGKASNTHWIGGLMGPRTSLDTFRTEIFLPMQVTNTTIPKLNSA